MKITIFQDNKVNKNRDTVLHFGKSLFTSDNRRLPDFHRLSLSIYC